MKAVAVTPSQKKVGIVEHTAPAVNADDQVLIKSLEVGICGTDREICTFVYGAPPSGSDYLVLGHESLGEVVEVGGNVRNLKPGDLVVPSVRRPCQHEGCLPCRQGLQDFCSTGDFVERGINQVHGFMTETYTEEEQYLTYVPPELRDVAVLVEPLTIAEKGLAQAWAVQSRLPWVLHEENGKPTGKGLRAVVLGAGPIGILGAMKLKAEGFDTYVYSRSKAPNPKADIVESFGVKYISSLEHDVESLAKIVGSIDLVYEGIGVSSVAFDVLSVLGLNGVYIFTGIPAPRDPIPIEADQIMRNIVLKNQAIVGTVNADKAAFETAITDLGIFMERWPDALKAIITKRYPIEACRELLLDKATGIKNIISFEE
ncbi:MAG: glucose 1-dehydrogenase [Akkermansiaceae bacterium]|nr:glucose 1-dehydrogenase [Akkermansiaceae bacterium]NNM29843.1 glucose 1-dehydrogenase [Akkermansiaceae bacterium]